MLQILPTDHASALVVRATGDVDAIQNAGALGVLQRMARTQGRVSVMLDLEDLGAVSDDVFRQGVAFAAVDRHAVFAVAIVGTGPVVDRVEALARQHTHADVVRFPPAERAAARAFVCRPAVTPVA